MAYLKIYQEWLNEPSLEKDLKEQLKALSKTEIKEAFYQDLKFGTAGARGLMGVGTNRFNIYTIKRLSLGFAKYIKKVARTTNYSVAISYDNRNNSKLFAYTAARVLASEGIKIFITKTLRPTPYLSYMVRHFGCDGGIMVTASHNPKEYNGFKVYDSLGGQLVPKLAAILTQEIEKIKSYFHIQEYRNDVYLHEVGLELDEAYLALVKEISLVTNKKKPLKFVYSPLHGAAGSLVEKLLTDLGYNFIPVKSQMKPDGNFTNAQSSNPGDSLAYSEALEVAKKVNADLILVTDPDGDRLGIMVKHRDEYLFLNGNQTASLELFYILSVRKLAGTLPTNGVVYFSNVTTPLIKDLTEHFNQSAKEVLTGFKFIGEAIENSTKPFLFGAEESYGSLISPFVRDKDAIQAVLLLVEMATYYHFNGLSLYDVLLDIYKLIGAYSEKTISLTYEGITGSRKIKKIMAYFRSNHPALVSHSLVFAEDYLNQLKYENGLTSPLGFPKSDVLRFVYKPNVTVILRPSGTESKLKLYLYVKAKNLKTANQKLLTIEQTILKQIKDV